MIELASFSSPINAAVIGASGGLGQAFVKQLENCSVVENIYAFSRSKTYDANEKVESYFLDICDEMDIAEGASRINKPLHLVLIATGILHDQDVMPEKTIKTIDQEVMERVFLVNTIGPSLIAKHFIPFLPKSGKSVFATLSARVGSISDNRLGGWHSYRASKAALNMMVKNIAIEIARKHKGASVIGLHPGTVDTKLSSPFQSNIKKDKIFSPEQSARYLLDVIDQVNSKDTGKVFAWDGQEIES